MRFTVNKTSEFNAEFKVVVRGKLPCMNVAVHIK